MKSWTGRRLKPMAELSARGRRARRNAMTACAGDKREPSRRQRRKLGRMLSHGRPTKDAVRKSGIQEARRKHTARAPFAYSEFRDLLKEAHRNREEGIGPQAMLAAAPMEPVLKRLRLCLASGKYCAPCRDQDVVSREVASLWPKPCRWLRPFELRFAVAGSIATRAKGSPRGFAPKLRRVTVAEMQAKTAKEPNAAGTYRCPLKKKELAKLLPRLVSDLEAQLPAPSLAGLVEATVAALKPLNGCRNQFVAEEFAQDAVCAGWCKVTREDEEVWRLRPGSLKGLRYENGRRKAEGRDPTTLLELAEEFGDSVLETSTMLCEYAKAVGDVLHGIPSVRRYIPAKKA